MTVAPGRSVVRNATALLLAWLLGAALNAALVVVAVRYLGATDAGKYLYVVAFVSVFQLAADFGLTNMLVAEMARDRVNAAHHLAAARALMWVISAVVFVLMIAVGGAMGESRDTLIGIAVVGLAALITYHAVVYAAVFRAHEEMEFNAVGFLLQKVLLLGFVAVAAALDFGLVGIYLAYLPANLGLWLYNSTVVRRRYFVPGLRVDTQAWRKLLGRAWPLGIAGVVRQASWQADLLILARLAGDAAAGIFGSAYRLIFALNQIPLAVAIALYPVFVRLREQAAEVTFGTFRRAIILLWIVGMPLALIGLAAPDRIVTAFGPEFRESAAPLRVMMPTLLFLFITAPAMFLFTALGRQSRYALYAGIALTLKVVADLALIPRAPILVPAYATLVSEFLLLAACLGSLARMGARLDLAPPLAKIALAAVPMGVALYGTRGSSLLLAFAGLLVGIGAYVALLLVLRVFPSAGWAVLLDAVRPGRRAAVSVSAAPASPEREILL